MLAEQNENGGPCQTEAPASITDTLSQAVRTRDAATAENGILVKHRHGDDFNKPDTTIDRSVRKRPSLKSVSQIGSIVTTKLRTAH